MFQIVRTMLDKNGDVIARRPQQPLFELREHAIAIAQKEASGLWGEYGYDGPQDCWWGSDGRGGQYRFVVEEITVADVLVDGVGSFGAGRRVCGRFENYV
jgi:hypothetical protein